MGRKRIHKTKEQVREANKKKSSKYYNEHREDIKRKKNGAILES